MGFDLISVRLCRNRGALLNSTSSQIRYMGDSAWLSLAGGNLGTVGENPFPLSGDAAATSFASPRQSHSERRARPQPTLHSYLSIQ